jgi:hypothetical protein
MARGDAATSAPAPVCGTSPLQAPTSELWRRGPAEAAVVVESVLRSKEASQPRPQLAGPAAMSPFQYIPVFSFILGGCVCVDTFKNGGAVQTSPCPSINHPGRLCAPTLRSCASREPSRVHAGPDQVLRHLQAPAGRHRKVTRGKPHDGASSWDTESELQPDARPCPANKYVPDGTYSVTACSNHPHARWCTTVRINFVWCRLPAARRSASTKVARRLCATTV